MKVTQPEGCFMLYADRSDPLEPALLKYLDKILKENGVHTELQDNPGKSIFVDGSVNLKIPR